MKIGIPKGLLYYKYHTFLETFLYELGAEIVTSPDTNKKILDDGVKYCVDEACLPIKIFHGHVAALKDACDLVVIPRVMQLREREFICPKFCGLPEMVINSVPGIHHAATTPIYASTQDSLYEWTKELGRIVTKDQVKIRKSFETAWNEQRKNNSGIKDEGYSQRIALIGHPYNLYDTFINMNIVKKLHKLGVGVITEESLDDASIDNEIKRLYKRPFWTFGRNSYGFATYCANNNRVDGIIYISSFACGIDSVVIELIKDQIGDFPFMVIKIDEHTGEAGIDTRAEAFVDMLTRRN